MEALFKELKGVMTEIRLLLLILWTTVALSNLFFVKMPINNNTVFIFDYTGNLNILGS